MRLYEFLRENFQLMLSFFQVEDVEAAVPDEGDLLAKVEYLYQGFDPLVLQHFRQSYGIGVNIPTLYRNIDLYCDKLVEFTNVIHHNGSPTAEMCQYTTQMIRFNRFILTKEDHYQLLEESFAALKQKTLVLIKTIRQAAKDKPDLESYTIRLTTPIFNNLIEILSVTREISLRD